ncbi:transporter substrate-binding domain-containing protein [Desulfovibrio mangrovi]|uniref:substrate-binding periplasmic protein n=1 Tax=Desulfovibrio mangrovi TaxID=2976983 RepID=UPI002247BED5|nr:transporter substrate-binding domain-containing protein [Desulfovibrio mangrovi]UZP66098.1 transporter substrate-binding domain-containing protein [Desulfovibrio mangrovi]
MTAPRNLFPILLVAIVIASLCTPFAGRADTRPQLLVLTENLAPYNYVQGRELKGGCADIVKEILRRTNTGIPQGIRILPWSRAYSMAQQHPDVALFSTVRSPERENKFRWVGPIYSDTLVMMKRRGSNARASNLEEAKKFTVGVMQDYAAEEVLRTNKFPRIYSIPGAPEQMIYMLAHDRVDMWLESWPSGVFYAARAGKPVNWLEPLFPVSHEELYIAFSPQTNPETIQRWSDALEEMRKDGTYAAILNRFEERLATHKLQ